MVKHKKSLKGVAIQIASFILDPIINLLQRIRPRHINYEISRDLRVSEKWAEIKFPSPLRIKRNYQEIVCYIEGYGVDRKAPYEKVMEAGQKYLSKIILDDGTIINPEVQIIDEFENAYSLKLSNTLQNVTFKNKSGQLTADRNYTKFRIKSDKFFICRKIYWHDYNLK